jgi:hypothetical protein
MFQRPCRCPWLWSVAVDPPSYPNEGP